MMTSSLYLLCPLVLFLLAMLLWRISPLRAVASDSARWLILPAFTLFMLLLIANQHMAPELRSPWFHWLMPGFGFALALFPALPRAFQPRLALRDGVFAALGLMLMSLALVL
nr:hypothetical protein [Aeromonas sp. RU39B]